MSRGSWAEMWRGRAVVYRCYGEDGSLLYVGYSENMPQRIQLHIQQPWKSPWWPLVSRLHIALAGDRQRARVIERQAIEAERPRYNRLGLVRARDWIPLRGSQQREAEELITARGGSVHRWLV